ncbi:PaaI family thioesterase [Alicycliphilus denitrificans]|uniref:Phenylacetic acid degradation-related protein n=2 Tax=Alicycliphilus denitrificans TaxID=179636 RepID=F4G8V1_ALIDK|nr:PaaI family thioesterase [Alicycliphilus denitrificans]GAO21842.1 phenylacetic acid degradation-like protein [Alicycliphilus sp. B1]ADU99633.1 thioesterase superfamily protein [Alicycliphilus denitrificans BC]AEB84460.1 phenylacetic acid degradation-related protein [Alicycliphilus denitrificans K601]QKD44545.1 PaaI family thioesterase [Alicycliphilus denitrificans]GAO23716.1 phenylacetic acid degradation-like protein [Alicycliphilus sp. B1]
MLDFGADIPFVKELGFTLRRMHGGESELHYQARPEHTNSFGVMHGGAVMTLLDVAMATAARSDTLDTGVVTIEMKTSFMRPARGPMVARGKLIQRTRSMAFAEAWVYDAEGRLCSQSTGTFKYVPRAQPAAGQGGGAISTD